jgi:hypothetical protein
LEPTTAELNIEFDGDLCENLVYTSGAIIFEQRLGLTMSLSDFMQFVKIVNAFQIVLVNNFDLNIADILPFGECTVRSEHNPSANRWDFICIFNDVPRVANYHFHTDTKLVQFIARNDDKSISWPEWCFFLMQLNHFAKSIKGF